MNHPLCEDQECGEGTICTGCSYLEFMKYPTDGYDLSDDWFESDKENE